MDAALRAAERTYASDPTPEHRDAYRAVRARSGLPTLPPLTDAARRARLLRMLEHVASEGREQCEWADGWAEHEPERDAPHGVVMANWNNGVLALVERYMGRLPSREQVVLEWSDQVSTCGGCNLAVRTSPDCMSWRPQFVVARGELLCRACVESDPERVRESLEREHGKRYMPELPDWFPARAVECESCYERGDWQEHGEQRLTLCPRCAEERDADSDADD